MNNFVWFDLPQKALNLNHVLRFEVGSCYDGDFVGAYMTDGTLVRIKEVSSVEEGQACIQTLIKNLNTMF